MKVVVLRSVRRDIYREPESRPWRLWYKTARWLRMRAAQLRREPLCRYCMERGRTTAATVADHRTPHRGDRALFFDADNLQSLCKPCHDGAKKSLEMTGSLRGADADGTPLDPNHHWN